MSDVPGQEFQKGTQYGRDTLSDRDLDWAAQPATYKLFTHAPLVPLPKPEPRDGPGLWTLISRRRSVRAFSPEPLTLSALGRLLWAATGITAGSNGDYYRAAPSAGALYPVETYVVAHRVAGLASGLYHYRLVGADDRGRADATRGHALETLTKRDLRQEIAAAALDQPLAAEAAAVFVWTAVFSRSRWKYGERAYRYAYLDAGHIAAHVSLAAVGLGLGACQIAAFFDDEVNSLLGVDGDEEGAIYLTVVGHPV
jgi:SagB-type dehydrogenase family enzyme